MFDSTSRYKNIEIAETTVRGRDGVVRNVKYVRRRFSPLASSFTVQQEHRVADGERLDTITALYLGDPTQFWRICDANNAMNPFDLTEHPGTVLDIAELQFGGGA